MGDIRPSPLSMAPYLPSSTHSSRFAQLLTSGHFSDLKILLGSETFRVHSLILAVSSPNFYNHLLLAQKKSSCSPDSVRLELDNTNGQSGNVADQWSNTFRHFLHFLYTGTSGEASKVDDALPLRQLAVRFQVPDLRDQLDSFLSSQFSEEYPMSDEEALGVWTQAVKFGDKELTEKGESFICRNAWTILGEDFDPALSLSRAELERILSSGQDLVLLSEKQLFNFLVRWTKKQPESQNKENDAFSLLEKVGLLKHLNLPQLKAESEHLAFEGNLTNGIDHYFDKHAQPHPRKYLNSPQTPEHTFSRFPQKFAYCTDNLGDTAEVIRFRVDTSLCLLSIGFPTYSQTGANSSFQIDLSIYEEGEEMTKKRTALRATLPHSPAIQHLPFPSPYKIRKNAWYVLKARIMGTPGYGNIGGKSHNLVRTGGPSNPNEHQVKFELKSDSDIASGQIDEFRFKLI